MSQVAVGRQSPGGDPKKRNSGLFSFLRWFRPSGSRESVNSDTQNSASGSCESISSAHSSGTVASFSFVPPTAYHKSTPKSIAPGPETDTYKARLKQRDKRREKDKNTTLRKKYNLFFNRDPLATKQQRKEDDENCRSLPLMTRKTAMQEERTHRRTASESSKVKRAGAYCHVKGKRKAPPPPVETSQETNNIYSLLRGTLSSSGSNSMRRKKRLAPSPPVKAVKTLTSLENAPQDDDDVLYNDSLKLDHGILKPAKQEEASAADQNTSARASHADAPVSPRPWYKRNTSREAPKKESTDPEAHPPLDGDPKANKDDKRKSGLTFLINISELDKEASRIVQQKNEEMPAFMRPKQEPEVMDTLQPKRRSARDLIAKFNAITNVTKVTVNSAFFGSKDTNSGAVQKRDYFGRQPHKSEELKSEIRPNQLAKSESASVIKDKADTPKMERKSWGCPKCQSENDYWRIICHVCSTIKPYFDELTPSKEKSKPPGFEGNFERAKTQIGFSALAKSKEKPDCKKEEREKLKKMLIEMKNSLPKRKTNAAKPGGSRTSVIQENPENNATTNISVPDNNNIQKPEEASVIIATTETVYENIKVKKTETPKPIKVSSSAQTSAVLRKSNAKPAIPSNFELLRPKDFADIYSDKTGKPSDRVYANLAQHDELSLFFNVPKKFAEIRNHTDNATNTDTIEINRLLRRLENAIAKGELSDAAIFARELAQLKVNCSVVRQKAEASSSAAARTGFTVDMYVEDKISHRGPFSINVHEDQTVAELKIQVEKDFEIPRNVQRWILGKELAVHDNATLKDHHVTTTGCPIFLYLVAPTNEVDKTKELKTDMETKATNHETGAKPKIVEQNKKEEPKVVSAIVKADAIVERKNDELLFANSKPPLAQQESSSAESEDYDSSTLKPSEWECRACTLINQNLNAFCEICMAQRPSATAKIMKKTAKPAETSKQQHYMQLVNLDNADVVENVEAFECLVCLTEIPAGEGVTLRECLHQFCKLCLAHTVEFNDEAQVKCPFRDDQYSCDIALQDREIKALVTAAVYDQFLAKSVAQAENRIDKSFHCKTPDCKGWCIFEDNVNEFRCPVCKHINCLTCQAIHVGLNCKQYQEKMNQQSETDEDAKRTKEMLDAMVSKGEALPCPACQVVLMKKWGCDWVRCSMCKTEICWVTRGLRWGPAGKGDTSGGCKCGVNGTKCHPRCNYCH